MKAFAFRLEQALRLRLAQENLQKSRVAEAAAGAAAAQHQASLRAQEAAAGEMGIRADPSGLALVAFAGFRQRMTRAMAEAATAVEQARRKLAEEQSILVELDRKRRLLEKLKAAETAQWQYDLDRELSGFADEAFLGRFASRIQSKNGRARSSGG